MTNTLKAVCAASLIFLCSAASLPTVFADEFTSSSFRILDPVLYPAGYSTSSGFSLTSTIAQIAIGTSTVTSGNARELRSGFEYFSFVNTPVVSATAGNGQVGLTWTASVGVLGFTVSAYEVGQSTIVGGPYTLTNVGAATSYTAASLSNGTPYYFIVRALDAFGRSIATSSQVSATPVAAPSPAPPPPSSGGGGGGYTPLPAMGMIRITGMAYPDATVHILVGGSNIKTVSASPLGNFDATITLIAAEYQFGVYAEDIIGRTSALSVFGASLSINQTTVVNNVLLSPTIAVDKLLVNIKDNARISGAAYPGSTVTLYVSPDPSFITNVRTVELSVAGNGVYSYQFIVRELPEAAYIVKARQNITTAYGSFISPLSHPTYFTVTNKPSVPKEKNICRIGDLNDDTQVDLIDFSIAVYWHKKILQKPFRSKEAECLNNDGTINIYDFSLMAYYWTG